MRKALFTILTTFSAAVWGQTACFTYSDDEQTIVSGTTIDAIYQIRDESSLTIPSNVVKVLPSAFFQIKQYGNNAPLELLIIEGNPEFESDEGKNALADLNDYLSVVEIQGTAMTVANIEKMLEGCDKTGTLEKIDIYNNEFPLDADLSSEAVNNNTTSNLKVVLPAARVGTQQFGNAAVYGRFTLTSEIASFCGNACFQDIDNGSNLLFYIPTEIVEPEGEKKVHIKRVHYIMPNQGVLRHKKENSSSYVELPRIDTDNVSDNQYDTDKELYDNNLLVGVTSPTPINATDTIDGEVYTNMILRSGSFYRTSGGTLGANRAYLQIKSSEVAGLAKLSTLVEDESTGIDTINNSPSSLISHPSSVYDLQGRKVTAYPKSGIYIIGGKKVAKSM